MRNATAGCAAASTWIYEGRAREEADLLGVLEAEKGKRPSFYWEHPEHDEGVLALGCVEQLVFEGPERLSAAVVAIESLAARWAPGPMHDPACPLPVLVGGFAFSSAHEAAGMWREFPSCWFVLPSELWLRARGRTWRIDIRDTRAIRDGAESAAVSVGNAGECQPDGFKPVAAGDRNVDGARERAVDAGDALVSRWSARVERALEKIASGELEKIVLARKTECSLPTGFDSLAVLRELRAERPQCFTFRIAPRDTVFFGSTPELLVRVEGREVETHALAGTAARAVDTGDDRASAEALHRSTKNRYEQDVVARDVLQALSPIAERLHSAREPRILSVPEAHHLITPISAHLGAPLGALAVAARLHPTPATCGIPRREAGALIDAEERDRGWYTGAVGWVSPNGDGAFAVALRSAVVDASRLVAWAGAGIVAGSRPAEEFAETELKLRAVLGALGA